MLGASGDGRSRHALHTQLPQNERSFWGSCLTVLVGDTTIVSYGTSDPETSNWLNLYATGLLLSGDR